MARPRKAKTPAATTVQRFDETNVARLGLISIQERIPEGYNSWTVDFEVEGRPARLSCDALPKHGGVPHGLDNDVSLALFTLFQEAGSPDDGTFTTTAYQILTAAGLDTSGHYYRAVTQSLERLMTTTYTASEAWRAPDGRWTTVKFRYLDRLEYTSDDDRLNLSGASVLRLTLAREIVRSIQAQYIKPINLEFLTSLQRPLTRALYRLLDAQRFLNEQAGLNELSVGINAWGEACKIVDRKPAKIRRTLEGAHEELLAREYLKAVSYAGRGTAQTITYTFAASVQEAEVDPAVVALATRFGVAPSVARGLVRRYGGTRVEERVQKFEAILAGGYAVRNRAAMLVDVIRDEDGKYADPEGFVSRAQREALEAKRRSRDQALQRQLDADDQQREAEWAGLSAEQRTARAMRTVGMMFGKRLGVSVLAGLQQRLLRGDLDPVELVGRTTRAAMEMCLEDLAAELTSLTYQER